MPIERPFKKGADFEYLREVILRRTTDGPVPVIEMMADGSIMGEVTGLEHTIDQMTELTDLDNPDRKGPRRSSGDGLKFLDLNLASIRDRHIDGACRCCHIERNPIVIRHDRQI